MTRTLVLLGIGHTNAHVMRQWISDPIADCRLVCVSIFPTATYSGMLPGTLAGQFDDGEMRIDLETFAEHAGAELVRGHASGIDLDSGQLLFSDRDPIQFDVLSIGVGSTLAGLAQHRDSRTLVPIKPMQTFLTRLDARIDQAVGAASRDAESVVRLAVVGGGVAGVEVALCLQQHVLGARSDHRFEITLHHASDRIANGLRRRTVRLLESLLRERRIEVRYDSEVTDVRDSAVITSDGSEHAADVVVWATGAAPPSVLAEFPLEKDQRGFLATTSTLQSKTDARIFAVGDCGTIIDSPSPKAGVYAVRQSPILWHNIHAFLRGGVLNRYRPQQDYLKLINTGKRKAVMEYGWLSLQAGWCWHLKTWIDKRFVQNYQFDSPSKAKTPLAYAGINPHAENR